MKLFVSWPSPSMEYYGNIKICELLRLQFVDLILLVHLWEGFLASTNSRH